MPPRLINDIVHGKRTISSLSPRRERVRVRGEK